MIYAYKHPEYLDYDIYIYYIYIYTLQKHLVTLESPKKNPKHHRIRFW